METAKHRRIGSRIVEGGNLGAEFQGSVILHFGIRQPALVQYFIPYWLILLGHKNNNLL